MFLSTIQKSFSCIALVAVVCCSGQAQGDVSGKSYVGYVYLQTPSSQIVPFYWTVTFDNGNVWMTANGVPIDGVYYQNGNNVSVLLNNPPYFSTFTAQEYAPFLYLTWFHDADGNSLNYGLLYPN